MENAPQFITIEKISNGFLVSIPEIKGHKKHHRSTINGLVQLLEMLWEKKYIHSERDIVKKVEIEKISLEIPSVNKKIVPKSNSKI